MFVSVCAMRQNEGIWHFALGASPGACKEIVIGQYCTVRYRVRAKLRFLGLNRRGGCVLRLASDVPVRLPELVLVVKSKEFH